MTGSHVYVAGRVRDLEALFAKRGIAAPPWFARRCADCAEAVMVTVASYLGPFLDAKTGETVDMGQVDMFLCTECALRRMAAERAGLT